MVVCQAGRLRRRVAKPLPFEILAFLEFRGICPAGRGTQGVRCTSYFVVVAQARPVKFVCCVFPFVSCSPWMLPFGQSQFKTARIGKIGGIHKDAVNLASLQTFPLSFRFGLFSFASLHAQTEASTENRKLKFSEKAEIQTHSELIPALQKQTPKNAGQMLIKISPGK